MIKVLITGASGLLGGGLIKTRPKDVKLILASYEKRTICPDPKVKHLALDITRKEEVIKKISKEKPHIIIHAASLGNVDLCEKNKKKAWEVNVEGTRNIIEAAQKVKAKIVYPSSNAVFSGQEAPYREEDEPKPVNFYGQTKYTAEILVQNAHLPFLLTRLITMYGWHLATARENPVTWLLKKVKLVNDVFFNPLYYLDAGEALWGLIKKQKEGIYHIAGAQRTNRYLWGILTAEVFGLEPSLIKPVASSYFKELAPRPKDTTYRIEKIKQEIGFKPKNLKEGLSHMRDNPLNL
jgi:dTDP-4-dehydrorhamnose reductase